MLTVKRATAINGDITVPGDKSISHRAVILAAISHGKSEISGFLQGEDCKSTIACFRKMGIVISDHSGLIEVEGKGLFGLSQPATALDAGNSGTTMRLLSGILAGQPFISRLVGDVSLQRRPMNRVAEPLRSMGAQIAGIGEKCLAPLTINGGKLKAIDWRSAIASAQVKSAILLAGLYADGATSVTEPVLSRDHTERMLRAFGADVRSEGTKATVVTAKQLVAQKLFVPGDISSAAFFLAAAALLPNSELIIRNVGLNPTRTGIIDVLQNMGANIELDNISESNAEIYGDIIVRGGKLRGTEIGIDVMPRLIDEVPVIAVLAMLAEGKTTISGAQELRVKESDRITAIVTEFRKMGANIEELSDGMVIQGGKKLRGAVIESYHDHRIAMAAAIAGSFADGQTIIVNDTCIDISFPGFSKMLAAVIR
ncbi:MAG: 3-phosphoshikimate 1-carboxyvinyltransferase [Negativicutes bacterium]|jgi:3-phosphoshikimate 1-carboxyvinyltransferase